MVNELRFIRRWLRFMVAALVISGLTALPIQATLEGVCLFYPYGYDWLAFAHFVMAIVFLGPLRDPVRNKWVIEAGMMACLLLIPFALIAGHFRGIPFWWRLIDCSFGLTGLLPLMICYQKIQRIESQPTNTVYDGNSIRADR